jgi:hypothetical protein
VFNGLSKKGEDELSPAMQLQVLKASETKKTSLNKNLAFMQ